MGSIEADINTNEREFALDGSNCDTYSNHGSRTHMKSFDSVYIDKSLRKKKNDMYKLGCMLFKY